MVCQFIKFVDPALSVERFLVQFYPLVSSGEVYFAFFLVAILAGAVNATGGAAGC